MSDQNRVKRPQAERQAPVRNWSTLFGGADNGGAAGRSPMEDVVGRSVEIASRVADEFLLQGERTAQRLSAHRPADAAGAGNVQELMTQMARYASDFFGVWLQFLEATAGGATPPPTAPRGDDGAAEATTRPAPPPEPSRHLGVRMEIRSQKPADVALDLKPDAIGKPLILHSLRAIEPEKPRIDSVRYTPATAEQAAVLQVHIPPDQPDGAYHAVLVEEGTPRTAGTLTVTIGAAEPPVS